MKKKWIVVAFAACAIALTSCNVVSEPESIAVESVTLDATTLTLAPGATRKLTATVKPDNADDKTVVWSSSDTAVAMVGNDGMVGAIKTGTATITAKSGDKTATCLVTVSEIAVENPDSPVGVESVMLNTTTLMIEPGKTRTLTATVTPNNAEDKTVTWSSSDEKVATVSDDGTVTAHAEGTATITAKAGGKEATCTVAVKPILIAVKSVSLNMTILTLTSGETGKLTATVTPSDADDSTVAWLSSNADVAMVGNDGTVTAIKAGKATITAQAGDITAECAVSVNPILVESVTLDVTTLTLAPGMTKKLAATVNPDNADDKTVTWSSSNVEVAMVSNDGTIGAIKTGTATITAQAGDKKATCVVTVNSQSSTMHVHYYSLGICTVCGFQKPFMLDGTIDDNGVLTNYRGAEATVTIPNGVIGIGAGAFENCESLKKVSIPSSVTAIGSQAFKGCSNLNILEMSTGLTGIGSYAFDGCTSLVNVSIPDSVSSIGDHAFSGCTKLASVTIPTNVPSFGDDAFAGCENITSMTYSGTLAQWCKQICDYNLMSYAKSVILAGENDLDLKTVTTLTIPEGVTIIESTAFHWCMNLSNVIIPTSVTNIVRGAFYNCKNLYNVQYGGTLAQWCSLDNDRYLMFYAKHVIVDSKDLKSMTDLVIPNGVKTVEDYAFSDCTNLKIVTIPDSVTSIGSVFVECTGLTSVTIPANVKNIGDGAFTGCKGLKSVTIPNSVTSLGAGAFARCDGLTSVTIPDSVTSIEMMTFYNCTSLTEVTIFEGVMSIGENAFDGCKNLTSVDIPASVTRIGEGAFSMTNLSTVKYGGTQEQWNKIEKGADIFSWTKRPTITGSDGSTWTAQ